MSYALNIFIYTDMHIFYTPDITSDQYLLDEQESKHASKVLRLSVGDQILLIDGKGGKYNAEILENVGKRIRVSVVSKTIEKERSVHYLHIAIAPTKNIERLEWFLEKATEIGVDEITPLLCRNSERKSIKDDRLERVVVAAMKQSIKPFMPKLNPLIKADDFIKQNHSGGKYIAHCYDSDKLPLKFATTQNISSIVMIGPEGDFSLEEVKLAEANGFQSVELGKERLRTETAGVVACHTVNLMNS